MPRYSEAVDGLHDLLRWINSPSGRGVMKARAEYLSSKSLTALDVSNALDSFVAMLDGAEPIYWEDRLVDIINKSAHSLPDDWRLTDPMLFTQNGFVYFARALDSLPDHGKQICGITVPIRAMAWRREPKSMFCHIAYFCLPDLTARHHVFDPRVLANVFMGTEYIGSEEVRKRLNRAYRLDQEDDPRARAYVEKTIEDALRFMGVTRPGGIPWVLTPWRVGQTMAQTHNAMLDDIPMDRDQMGEVARDMCEPCQLYYLRVFAASLNFLNTRVFISNKQPTDRTTLLRTHPKPQWTSVNVITLRHAERVKHPSDIDHKTVDWSCHFLVGAQDGGFWRNQYYAKTGTHQYKWIDTYMKGDLTKPFKPPSSRVYRVAR